MHRPMLFYAGFKNAKDSGTNFKNSPSLDAISIFIGGTPEIQDLVLELIFPGEYLVFLSSLLTLLMEPQMKMRKKVQLAIIMGIKSVVSKFTLSASVS